MRAHSRSAEQAKLQGVLNGVDDKPEGFDGNIDALLAAKAQAKAQLQASCHLLVRSAGTDSQFNWYSIRARDLASNLSLNPMRHNSDTWYDTRSTLKLSMPLNYYYCETWERRLCICVVCELLTNTESCLLPDVRAWGDSGG